MSENLAWFMGVIFGASITAIVMMLCLSKVKLSAVKEYIDSPEHFEVYIEVNGQDTTYMVKYIGK